MARKRTAGGVRRTVAEEAAGPPLDAGAPRRQLFTAVIVLVLLPLVLYWDVVFGGHSFVLRDHQTLTIPAHDFIHRALLGGSLPQWWDSATLGFPFASNPALQGLSPLAWLFGLLPQPFGADLEPVGYVAVLGVGTALFARRLGAGGVLGPVLAGALAECSGYVASVIPNGAMPYVAWVPWMAWAADRLAQGDGRPARLRAAIVFSLVTALQLIGGEPGTVVTSALLAALVLAVRSGPRRYELAGWALAAGVAGALLSAFSTVPALVFGGETERAGGVPLADAVLWSMHPLRLVELVWPHLLGDPVSRLQYLAVGEATAEHQLGPTWAASVFVGYPALLLAARGASRRTWPLLAGAVLFILLAMGSHTPLFAVFRLVFPPERYFRYPEKHVLGALVLVWALAGVGVARLAGARRDVRWLLCGLAVAVVALGAMLVERYEIVATLARYAAAHDLFADADGALRHVMVAGGCAAIAILAAAGGVRLARSRPRLGSACVAAAAVAVCAADARSVTVTMPRHDAPPSIVSLLPPGTRIYRNAQEAWRSGTAQSFAEAGYETIDGGIASQFGISSIPGYWLPLTADLKYFWDEVLRSMAPRAWARTFGMSWAILSDATPEWALSRDVVATFADHPLARIADVRPRAFVTSGWFSVPDARTAMRALAPRDRDLRAVALENVPPAPARPVEAVPCQLDLSLVNRAELLCQSNGGYAVLLDLFAPGWSATVDGVPADIVRADGLFRAVAVGPGKHRVVFEYRTPGLPLGAALSAFAAVALAAAWYATRRQRSAAEAVPARRAA